MTCPKLTRPEPIPPKDAVEGSDAYKKWLAEDSNWRTEN
jgi:hypothetical protein